MQAERLKHQADIGIEPTVGSIQLIEWNEQAILKSIGDEVGMMAIEVECREHLIGVILVVCHQLTLQVGDVDFYKCHFISR